MKKILREELLNHNINQNNIEEGWFSDTAKRFTQTAKGAIGVEDYNPHGVDKSVYFIKWYDDNLTPKENIQRLQNELKEKPKDRHLKELYQTFIKLNAGKKFQENFNLIKKAIGDTSAVQTKNLDDNELVQLKNLLKFMGSNFN
jgi:uncharacterized protein YeaO (DUF488 family)